MSEIDKQKEKIFKTYKFVLGYAILLGIFFISRIQGPFILHDKKHDFYYPFLEPFNKVALYLSISVFVVLVIFQCYLAIGNKNKRIQQSNKKLFPNNVTISNICMSLVLGFGLSPLFAIIWRILIECISKFKYYYQIFY